jgi:hypothetical protein
MKAAERHRGYAARCVSLAQKLQGAEKAFLLEMAMHWQSLGDGICAGGHEQRKESPRNPAEFEGPCEPEALASRRARFGSLADPI